MTDDCKKRPRFEFFSGESRWEGLIPLIIQGGPFSLLLVILWPILVIAWSFALIGSATQSFPRAFAVLALVFGIAGFVLFSAAKFSVFRQGRWMTFGSRQMTPYNRRRYRCGCGLLVLSAAISLTIVLIGRGVKF